MESDAKSRVEFGELAIGIVALCGSGSGSGSSGGSDDAVSAMKNEMMFMLADLNNDQLITPSEMSRFIRSLLRGVSWHAASIHTMPKKQLDQLENEVVRTVVQKCFADCGLFATTEQQSASVFGGGDNKSNGTVPQLSRTEWANWSSRHTGVSSILSWLSVLDLLDVPPPPSSAPPPLSFGGHASSSTAPVAAADEVVVHIRPSPTASPPLPIHSTGGAAGLVSPVPTPNLLHPTAPPLSRPGSEHPIATASTYLTVPSAYGHGRPPPVSPTVTVTPTPTSTPAVAGVTGSYVSSSGFRRPIFSTPSVQSDHRDTKHSPAQAAPASAVKSQKSGGSEVEVVVFDSTGADSKSSAPTEVSSSSAIRLTHSDLSYITRIARATGFQALSIEDLRKILYAHTEPEYEGVLDAKSWRAAILYLLKRSSPAASGTNTEWEIKGLSKQLDSLFALCDIDSHGIMGVSELACALAVLTSGSAGSKLQAAFRLFDGDSGTVHSFAAAGGE